MKCGCAARVAKVYPHSAGYDSYLYLNSCHAAGGGEFKFKKKDGGD